MNRDLTLCPPGLGIRSGSITWPVSGKWIRANRAIGKRCNFSNMPVRSDT